MRYHLIINESSFPLEEYKKQLIESFKILDILRMKTKNSWQQIRLTIYDASVTTLMNYSSNFTNIYHLTVFLKAIVPLTNDFDFRIFNNIHKVSLYEFTGITTISTGLENIRELELCHFQDLLSIQCPLRRFHKVSIISCKSLQSLPVLEETTMIELMDIGQQGIIDLSGTRDSLRSLIYRHNQQSPPNYISNLHGVAFDSLQEVTLINLLPGDFPFSSLSHISKVTLEFNSKLHHHFPSFPIFHGKYLHLKNVNVSSWSDKKNQWIEMNHLHSLQLENCFGLDRLPIFRNVKQIQLINIKGAFDEIRTESLPYCRNLVVAACSNLRVIYRLPKIQSIEINHCQLFSKFIGFLEEDHLGPDLIIQKVLLNNLKQFRNVSSLRNVHDLHLFHCPNLKSFDGFDQTILFREQRKMQLYSFNAKDCDMKGLGNIGRLEFVDVSNLLDGKGIHDIDRLLLKRVTNLTSFCNFYGLHQSVTICTAYSLVSFDGLQSVPQVALLNIIPRIKDFTGLMNCGQVVCYAVYPLIEEATAFQLKHETSSEAADVFRTIREFYVLKVSPWVKDFSFIMFDGENRLW
jgi:hypothetical protein